jgi:nucleoside-diphosphate-sugar epimerase
MPSVAVTGVRQPVGRRLVAALTRAAETEVVAVDGPHDEGGLGLDLHSPEVKSALDGVSVLIHTAWAWPVAADPEGDQADANLSALAAVLDAAAAAGVSRVVLLSSAAVYGAWPDNPVPIPETAEVRPNPGGRYAEAMARAEGLVAEWRDDNPGSTAVFVRASLVVGLKPEPWVTRDLGGLRAVRLRGSGRPIQFVHADDLVEALVLLATSDVDGPVNVAPDGWISAETAKALASGPVHLGLPRPLALAVLDLPDSYVPYLCEPWVVANDRLRTLGWSPEHTNEEALVAGRPASPWQKISPRRRQEAALAAAGIGVSGLVAAVIALVRRSRR